MGSILFVDDEVNILESLKRGLFDEDYECYFAKSGKEALKIMETKPISVLVTDMKMPEMDGLTLLKEVQERHPKTVRIVLSGYTQLPQLLATINYGDIFKFITKPWKLEGELKVILRQALDYYQLQVDSEEMKKTLEIKNQVYQNMLKNVDEVVGKVKDELQVVSSVGLETLSFISTLFEEGKSLESIRFGVDLMNRWYPNLIKVVASDESEISIKQVLEEYISVLKHDYKISKVDVVDQMESTSVILKSRLISAVLKCIKEIFTVENQYYVKFICTEQAVDGDTGQVELVMLISSLVGNTLPAEVDYSNVDETLEVLTWYVTQFLTHYEVAISAKRIEHNIIIKVQIHYQKR